MFAKISRRLAGKRWGLYNDDRGIIKVCRTHSKHSNSRLRLNNNTAPHSQIFTIYEDKDRLCCPDKARAVQGVALFDMPNLNRFDILSISIFCKIALSISISISIFSKITISISISISIFLELPYRYRYRYRYFSELPYRYRYRYRYFQLLHIDIDIDIDIFQKCRYIDNRYFISIF